MPISDRSWPASDTQSQAGLVLWTGRRRMLARLPRLSSLGAHSRLAGRWVLPSDTSLPGGRSGRVSQAIGPAPAGHSIAVRAVHDGKLGRLSPLPQAVA